MEQSGNNHTRTSAIFTDDDVTTTMTTTTASTRTLPLLIYNVYNYNV